MSHRPSTTTSSHNDPPTRSFPPVSLPATTDPPTLSNPPKSPAVWLIFGATGHMGQALTKSCLSHGDRVCAVGQLTHDSLPSMSSLFNPPSTPTPRHYLGTLCDVRFPPTVTAAFQHCLTTFGAVDIIAICTGYGVLASCEDQDDPEIRAQFEVNVMGTLNIVHASLPYFRMREQGRYLIFSSTSGALGVPGQGVYCATKYAVEGLVESMLYEVDGFGVKLSLVVSGHVKRDNARDANSSVDGLKLPVYGHFKIKPPSKHYASPDAPAAHAQRMLQWIGDNQPTSAIKSAELVWQLGHCSYPPLRLLLGAFAVESIRDRLKSVTEEMEDWKHLHFPAVEGGEGEGEREDGEDENGEEAHDGHEAREGDVVMDGA